MPATYIYTLSLHDALPISDSVVEANVVIDHAVIVGAHVRIGAGRDRKSTRLNSSHVENSYAVFCLKKKTEQTDIWAFLLQALGAEHISPLPLGEGTGRFNA